MVDNSAYSNFAGIMVWSLKWIMRQICIMLEIQHMEKEHLRVLFWCCSGSFNTIFYLQVTNNAPDAPNKYVLAL